MPSRDLEHELMIWISDVFAKVEELKELRDRGFKILVASSNEKAASSQPFKGLFIVKNESD
ncbi:hypothetical protein UFOVP610_18 [uncultured Caudovirales phage]|uniref:Uncharacterized protein n=1 Tax=uncultured Caudovirales phage TaxID=2100421 RepID=A0A6J5N097_9CAUD|nr:hypothetical protein UFOVP610_18 [uncultured Caudovirales phage]